MYNLDNKDNIQKWSDYCFNNYNQNEANEYLSLYMKTMYSLDIGNLIINKIHPNFVDNAYGNYNSKLLVLLDHKDKQIIDTLDDIFKKVFNKEVYEFCFTFYNKVRLDNNLISNGINNLFLYALNKEIKAFNPMFILNFSDKCVDTLNKEVFNYDKTKIERLSKLYNEDDLSDNDKDELLLYKKELWKLLKPIKNKI